MAICRQARETSSRWRQPLRVRAPEPGRPQATSDASRARPPSCAHAKVLPRRVLPQGMCQRGALSPGPARLGLHGGVERAALLVVSLPDGGVQLVQSRADEGHALRILPTAVALFVAAQINGVVGHPGLGAHALLRLPLRLLRLLRGAARRLAAV